MAEVVDLVDSSEEVQWSESNSIADEPSEECLSALSLQDDEEWAQVQEQVQRVLTKLSLRPRTEAYRHSRTQNEDIVAVGPWSVVANVRDRLTQKPSSYPDVTIPGKTLPPAPAVQGAKLSAIYDALTVLCSRNTQERQPAPIATPTVPARPQVESAHEGALLRRLAEVAEAGLGAVGTAAGVKRRREEPQSEGSDKASNKKHRVEDDELALKAARIEWQQFLQAEGLGSLSECRAQWAALKSRNETFSRQEAQHAQKVAEMQRELLIRDATILELQAKLQGSDQSEALRLIAEKITQLSRSGQKVSSIPPQPTKASSSTTVLGGVALLVSELQSKQAANAKTIELQRQTIQRLEAQLADVKQRVQADSSGHATPSTQDVNVALVHSLRKRSEEERTLLRETLPALLGHEVSSMTIDQDSEAVQFELLPLAVGVAPSRTAVSIAQSVLDAVERHRLLQEVKRTEESKQPEEVPQSVETEAVVDEPSMTEPEHAEVEALETETTSAIDTAIHSEVVEAPAETDNSITAEEVEAAAPVVSPPLEEHEAALQPAEVDVPEVEEEHLDTAEQVESAEAVVSSFPIEPSAVGTEEVKEEQRSSLFADDNCWDDDE